jgi:hypothetical protein
MASLAARCMSLERSVNIERFCSLYSMTPSLAAALDKQIIYLIIILHTHFCLDGTFILWGKSVIVYLKKCVFSKLLSD